MFNRVSALFFLVAVWVATAAAQSLPTMSGGRISCTDGLADVHKCHEIDMLSRVSIDDLYAGLPGAGADFKFLNEIWGWTDPVTEREYALVGRHDAVAFVDVTTPTEPVYLGYLPSHDGEHWWRDMKVYQDHMFVVVDGDGANGMQVFDLTQLRNFAGQPVRFQQSARYDGVGQAHNVAINEETGFAYIVGADAVCPGLHMVDIRNPLEPEFAGCVIHRNTGRTNPGYTHDTQCVIYRGPDTDHYGREICFSSNETALSVMDVTDKSATREVAAAEYPNVAYAHQGWLSENHQYFVMNDELDERRGNTERTRMLIWDVTDLDDPILAREFLGQTRTVDHNLYVRAEYVFASNYTSGLRVFDIRNPADPSEVAYFDTHPGTDDLSFDGAWSAYPFFASGTIIANSHPDGLLVLKPTNLSAVAFADTIEDVAYTQDQPVVPLILPEAKGGSGALSYTLSPELPAGLDFDATSRTLSGTPTEVTSGTAEYTFTASDAGGGADSLTFGITVFGAVLFADMVADLSLPRVAPMTPLVLPAATGGAPPLDYTLTPEPLTGLMWDATLRTLSGTPTEVTPAPVRYHYKATDANGASDSLQFTIEVYSPTGTQHQGLPEAFIVRGNYPNPFEHSTRIVLDLPWPARVTVEVLDVAGRRVLAVPPRHLDAGWRRSVEIGGQALSSGLFIYHVAADSPEGRINHSGRFVRIR